MKSSSSSTSSDSSSSRASSSSTSSSSSSGIRRTELSDLVTQVHRYSGTQVLRYSGTQVLRSLVASPLPQGILCFCLVFLSRLWIFYTGKSALG